MRFNDFFEKIAWTAMTAVALYAATQLREMSTSVNQLNTNVAVLVERMTYQERSMDSLANRITTLERKAK